MARRRPLAAAGEDPVTVSRAAAPEPSVEASESSAGALGAMPVPHPIRRPAERRGMAEVEELFRLHERALGQFLRQLLDDPALADDLIQDTFMTAARERKKLPSIENPRAWLFQIARNRALHAMRTRRRGFQALQRLARELRVRGTHSESTADATEAAAVREHLAQHLKPEERALLVLRYVHGFKSPELAEIVDRSPEAIRKELSRTRRKLIHSLEEAQMDSSSGHTEGRTT